MWYLTLKSKKTFLNKTDYETNAAPLAATLLSILRIKPYNTLPGPTSINSVPPSAIIACIDCVHLTGAVN
jgi:hypothetical protein